MIVEPDLNFDGYQLGFSDHRLSNLAYRAFKDRTICSSGSVWSVPSDVKPIGCHSRNLSSELCRGSVEKKLNNRALNWDGSGAPQIVTGT